MTRRLRVSSDDTQVCLDGLPFELADDSVRVESLGGARRVEQATVRFAVPSADEDAALPLDEALAELRLALALADRRHETLRAAADQLSGLELRRRMGPEDGIPAGASPTRARLQWLGLQAQQLRRVQDDLAEAREECRIATEQLEAATAAEQSESSARQARPDEARKVIAVTLAAGDDADLEISYRVSRCRWAPSYVLRIREEDGARLEMRALIAQQTGEDWSGAEISVSTASNLRWVELPEVKALKVGRRQSSGSRPGWRAPPENTDRLYGDFDRAREQEPSPEPPPVPLEPPGSSGGDGAKPRAKKRRRAPARASAMPPPAPMAAAAPMDAGQREEESVGRRAFGAADPEMLAAMGGGAMLDEGELDELMVGMAAPEDRAAPESAELFVSRQLMDYGALRLQGPESAQRGTLQREPSPVMHFGEALHPPSGHQWQRQGAEHDYTYVADGRHSIPSDGAPHGVAVLAATPTLERRYVCVPGQSTDVYRLCVARNPLDAPLPSGPLDVYQDGQFSLTTPLEAVAPGGRFELGLGVEQGIKVARKVSFEEDTEGLLKRQHAFEHHVQVEVQNLLKHGVALEVRERVPVPARRDDPDVEVAERKIEPRWDPFDPPGEELKGGRRWTLTVPPEARTTLTAQWVVRVPRGRELVGGNRRAR